MGRKQLSLSEIEVVLAWQTLMTPINPYHPKTSSEGGRPWHFGLKVHADTDKESDPIHSAMETPANVHE